ncbi:MAG: hypothetical protein JWM80_685 [Cyanobacteria bacterium RYN_339]|nr:hypothetical protein [Cyanobacteria bacterium RYN_339]
MAKAVESVQHYMLRLEHPLKAEIEALRALILAADEGITERVKWNAPSFCWKGDDRVTLKLHPPKAIGVIFHRGVQVKDAADFDFPDDSGLLTWPARDRAVATIRDLAELEANREALISLVRRWMLATV